jgi:chromate transport protein ChrA
VVEAAISLLVFLSDPIGLGEQKHRAIDTGLAVATQYLPAPPSQLAVVLIDRATLEDWKLDWPITYTRSAELIHVLACARVAGVFFDFTVGRKFNLAEGTADLQRAVEDSSRGGTVCPDGEPPAKIPVFFGKIDGVTSPMGDWLAQRNASFSINAGESDSIYQTGSEEFPSQPLRQEEVSPAFGIIRVIPALRSASAPADDTACRDGDPRPRCWTAPLALVWNASLDPKQPQVSDILKCRGNRGILNLLWGLTQFGVATRYETCPPVLTLSGVDLFRDLDFIEKHGDPAAALNGRFVLVGVKLAGLNDWIATPLHDHLPGVYKHAVALGALIRHGADYPTVPKPLTLALWAAAIYLVLETAREFLRGRRSEYVWFVATCVACATAFSLVVYLRNWPASLVVAVFGYYASVVFTLFFADRARYQSSLFARFQAPSEKRSS